MGALRERFTMKQARMRILQEGDSKGAVIYWMSRDQRVRDNWALVRAQEEALRLKQPLVVVFCLTSNFLEAGAKIYRFMLQGLKEIEKDLRLLRIPLIILKGNPVNVLRKFIEDYKIGKVITDFSPLHLKRKWINELLSSFDIPFYEVDAHNVIPCWHVSPKKEYAAYTLRSKINDKLNEFLEEFPKLKEHPYESSESFEENDWKDLDKTNKKEYESNVSFRSVPGEGAAQNRLEDFIKNKFSSYASDRNDPNKDATSNLSPYLHFGHISAQRIVLECQKIKKRMQLKGTFYDEIIVRRELSDNFCFYEPNYDTMDGFPDWAQQSLNSHRNDPREYIYTLEELEGAQTHDDAWNAAQVQMITTGKMHGYMRMYWGKKILEWTESPEDAMEIAILLNNRYELDGRDPNGYAGIAWSIGGVHDRAWRERNIFGKVRYMSYDGLKRKFNLDPYIEKYQN